MWQSLGFESPGLKVKLLDAQRHRESGLLGRAPRIWPLSGGTAKPLTGALSLQFCAELNQPILPNIRKWRGPRGCWKAAVAEKPSSLLHKVPALQILPPFLFHFSTIPPSQGHF